MLRTFGTGTDLLKIKTYIFKWVIEKRTPRINLDALCVVIAVLSGFYLTSCAGKAQTGQASFSLRLGMAMSLQPMRTNFAVGTALEVTSTV